MSPSETAAWSPVEISSFSDDSFRPRCPLAMAPSAISPSAMAPTVPFNSRRRFSSATNAGRQDSQEMIGKALRARIDAINVDECDAGVEDAFFVADLGEVFRQHKRWKIALPRVEPFYAVKCNGDEKVLRLLAALGTGFDCASVAEIQKVLNLGVPPSRIVYANPCKTASYVRYASAQNVQMMTFDNAEELHKVKKFFPEARLLLRILTDDSKALCRLSCKYGAPLDSARHLLELAKELRLNVVGVSFHVGSGSYDPTAFVAAVQDARKIFDEAAAIGYEMRTLDVGGGYGNDNFEAIASVLGPAIDQYFPPSVRVIAEPGRYYVSSAFTIATHIIARRTVHGDDVASPKPSYMLYLNDGLYGNFSGMMFDHQKPVAKVLKHGGEYFYESSPTDSQLTQYSIWGPTCDGIDCVSSCCYLPEVLDVGDWLYFTDMGAYSKCSATKFNGFNDSHDVVYVVSDPGALALLEQLPTFSGRA